MKKIVFLVCMSLLFSMNMSAQDGSKKLSQKSGKHRQAKWRTALPKKPAKQPTRRSINSKKRQKECRNRRE